MNSIQDIFKDKSQNLLCDLLDINFPIIQAGMSGYTTPELVAAVSNSGGIGILGAARFSSAILKENITKIKEKTKKPFGVNLLLAPPEIGNNSNVSKVQDFMNKYRQTLNLPLVPSDQANNISEIKLPPNELEDKLNIIMKERVPLLSIDMGDPTNIIDKVHDSNKSNGHDNND